MSIIIGKVVEKANVDEFLVATNKHVASAFVSVPMEHISTESKILGEVIDKQAVNPYFERATAINYTAEEDESIKNRSLYMIRVKPLAFIKDCQSEEVKFPPLPGSNVLQAEEADIKLALQLPADGIDIGFLKGARSLSVKISINRFLRTHVAILGQTGSGKSYLASKIALELQKIRRASSVPSEIGLPIILDSTGEYSGEYDLGEHKCLSEVMRAVDISEYTFPLLNEKYLPLLYSIYDINEKQESELRIWLGSAWEDVLKPESGEISKKQRVTMTDEAKQLISQFHALRITSTRQLANQLEEYLKEYNRLKGADKITVPYNSISKMRRLNFKIKKTGDLDFTEMLANGLIVNLSGQETYEEKQISMLLLLRQLFEAKRVKKINSKLVLFLDEAHNYVPSVYKSFCKDEILRLAREGRKYGITLSLISQRPRWVDPTALSQCGNIFIFRIQNSDDKKHIFDSASLPDVVESINIAKFETGEMIVTGDVARHTINCLVSPIDMDYIAAERKRIAAKYTSEIRKL